jgi:hypothetical protein
MTKYIKFNHNYDNSIVDEIGILVEPTSLEEIVDDTHSIVVKQFINLFNRRITMNYRYFVEYISDIDYIDEMTYKLLTS